MSVSAVSPFFMHVVISSLHTVADVIKSWYFITDSNVIFPLVLASWLIALSPLGLYTAGLERSSFNKESSIMTPYWVKVALFAVGRSCVSVFMEWHSAGIMFYVWACAPFVIVIPSLCICPHYLNQFYNFQQSTLKQEVRTHNNGLLNHFFLVLLLLYVSSPASQ